MSELVIKRVKSMKFFLHALNNISVHSFVFDYSLTRRNVNQLKGKKNLPNADQKQRQQTSWPSPHQSSKRYSS